MSTSQKLAGPELVTTQGCLLAAFPFCKGQSTRNILNEHKDMAKRESQSPVPIHLSRVETGFI